MKINASDTPITYFHFDEIDSTNQYLLSLPDLGPNMVCTANTQTQGRGRHGKIWYSPKQENLYLSLSYPLPENPDNWSGLSCAVGLLLCDCLRSQGYPATIKWPNDIFLSGKKCAGILIEVKNKMAVIGIGLNLRTLAFPDSLEQPVISLDLYDTEQGRQSHNQNHVDWVNDIVNGVYSGLHDFTGLGFAPYQLRWDKYDHYFQQRVSVYQDNQILLGTNQGVSATGELRFLSEETGELIQYTSANLSMRAADPSI